VEARSDLIVLPKEGEIVHPTIAEQLVKATTLDRLARAESARRAREAREARKDRDGNRAYPPPERRQQWGQADSLPSKHAA
jgi:hypothetical protein